MALIATTDLAPFADIEADKAQAMIDDAAAMAILVAPCLATETELTPGQLAAAKAVLRTAILRWNEAGSGALASLQQSAGSFQVAESYDTRQPRRTLFQAGEIEQLRAICATASGGAFAVDTAPIIPGAEHSLICSIMFGADYCSCGADIAGEPITGEA